MSTKRSSKSMIELAGVINVLVSYHESRVEMLHQIHHAIALLPSQTSSLTTGIPRSLAEPAGPSASCAGLSLLSHILSGVAAVCSAERALRRCATSRREPSGNESRGVYQLASSAVFRPSLGQEVVKVSRDQAGRLFEGCLRRRHDESHSKHRVREVLGGEGNDEVAELPVGVLLGIGVRKGECQGA
jgi:hypothetical protein